MKIKTLTLENFQTFRDPVTLPLEDQGLVMIQGRNEISSTVSSNGVGKSTIAVDGLAWTLFGKTLSGRTHDAVANRFTGDRCVGRVVGDGWMIERARRPSSLLLRQEGRDDFTNADAEFRILSALGFGFNTFRSGAVFGQGFDRFASADHDEQIQVFDELLGVNFKFALKRAKEWGKTTGERLIGLQAQRSRFQDSLWVANKLVAYLLTQQKEFQASQKDAEKLSGSAVKERLQAYNTAEAALNRGVKARDTLELLERWRGEQDRLTKKITTAMNVSVDSLKVYEKYKDEFRDAKKSFADLLEQPRCPTCLQSVDHKTIKPLIQDKFEAMHAEFSLLEEQHDRNKETLRLARAAYTKWWTPIEKSKDRCFDGPLSDIIVGEFKAQVSQLPRLRREAERTKEALDAARTQNKKVSAKTWSGLAELRLAKKDVEVHEEKLDQLEVDEAKLQKSVKTADFWIQGFGDRGIRSFLFQSVSEFVSERLQHHLSLLAGEDVEAELKLDVVRGRERIIVETSWQYGSNEYKGASPGQDRRVDIAMFAALQDFAEQSTASGFPFRAFDEPSDALDDRGRELLVEWIQQQAKGRGTTLLITHSNEFASMINPDHVWTVVLTDNGAKVEMD